MSLILLLSFFFFTHYGAASPTIQTLDSKSQYFNPKLPPRTLSSSKKFDGSSDLVDLRYHMDPVLSSPINIYLIWYDKWNPSHQLIIKDFLLSISIANQRAAPSPSVTEWWRTVSLYTDQIGANVSRSILIAGKYSDRRYSFGIHLTRLTIQDVIATAVQSKPFPVDNRNGIYLILTSVDVTVQDFSRAVYTLPYAWVGNSSKQCPEVCVYPFAVPNVDVGVDRMISVIGHELTEVALNPLVNVWYTGEDPTTQTEIGDLCEGLYGSGDGYIGQVMSDGERMTYNLNGRRGKKFLVQWIWSPVLKACAGPNASD